MAVKLRLRRMGATKKPFYRIVAADSKFSRDGRFIEILGTFNPFDDKNKTSIDEEKAMKWLNNGAIPTDTVKDLFSEAGIMKKFHDSRVGK